MFQNVLINIVRLLTDMKRVLARSCGSLTIQKQNLGPCSLFRLCRKAVVSHLTLPNDTIWLLFIIRVFQRCELLTGTVIVFSQFAGTIPHHPRRVMTVRPLP
jgi:hypothetical protein